MGTFFIYILKSAACLILFYLFYRLLLSKETFHRFNRIALLGILLLSLLIPFIEITTTQQTEVGQAMLTIEQLMMMAQMSPAPVTDVTTNVEENSVSWIQITMLVYLGGILFFACRNLYTVSRLLLVLKSGKRVKFEKGIVLIILEKEIAPFSWMRYIVISRKDMEENGREILIHESAHIGSRHSADLLIADICIFFQWFNPGAWLLKQELQNIHEYEADETVIKKGVDAKQYQLLLIKKAVGTRLYSMANSFNHSKLKKRITMMLKEKSNPWARLKYLYVLPLAAIAVTAFARPEVSEKVEEISAVKVNDLANFMQENVLQDTVKVPQSKKNTSIEAYGAKAKGLEVKGVEEKIIFEVVEQMPEYPGGMDALRKYLADKIDGSKMKGKAGGRVIVGFTVTKTGKVAEVQVLESDQPVLNEEAEKIVREMPDWIPGKQRNRPADVKYSIPVEFGNVRFSENKQPMILVDGKEISMADFEKMNKEEIESMSVLKDSASIGIYGQRGANGVILVSTKKADTTNHAYGKEIKKSTTNSTIATNVVPDFLVTGTVVDEQGRPKPGVSVITPNTTNGTFTDTDGHFKIKAAKDGYLLFSHIGYKPVKTAVAPTMTIRMEQEVVRLLRTVKNTSSTSGIGMTNGINIHGIKAGEQPLVIINGKESMQKDALSKIAPDRIKSFSILKDKSVIDVYGEKGKYGVILVELLSEEEYQNKQGNIVIRATPSATGTVNGSNFTIKAQGKNSAISISKTRGLFDGKQPLIIINGIKAADDALINLSPDSVNVDKNKSSFKISYTADSVSFSTDKPAVK